MQDRHTEILCMTTDMAMHTHAIPYSALTIRLHMYVDDFEVCNPIGSRRSVHKLTAIYFVVGNVPPKYWSQASGIYLALLARCKVS